MPVQSGAMYATWAGHERFHETILSMEGSWELARRATARKPMRANARKRLNRHQIGCRWIRPGATWSVAVTVSRESNGERRRDRSFFRIGHRTPGDGRRHDPVFQPLNGNRLGLGIQRPGLPGRTADHVIATEPWNLRVCTRGTNVCSCRQWGSGCASSGSSASRRFRRSPACGSALFKPYRRQTSAPGLDATVGGLASEAGRRGRGHRHAGCAPFLKGGASL